MESYLQRLVLMMGNIYTNIDTCQDPKNTGCEPPGKDDIVQLIINITNIALALIGTISLVFLIVGGIWYMTSGGNPDMVGKAKNTIFYAIVGLVLSIIAWAIVNFIIGAFA